MEWNDTLTKLHGIVDVGVGTIYDQTVGKQVVLIMYTKKINNNQCSSTSIDL